MDQPKTAAKDHSLAGITVLVTRAGKQSRGFTQQIESAGGRAIVLPAIEIQPPEDFAEFDAAVAKIESYDWLIFTSVNSVAPFLDRLRRAGKAVAALSALQIAAIGPETARRLEAAGIRTTLVPGRFQAEGILDALAPASMAGKRVLIPRAAEAREVLPQTLREWGASVDVLIAYRTALPNIDSAPIKRLLRRGEIDVITFTSSSTVRNFVRLFDGGSLAKIRNGSLIACIGPITAQAVKEAGAEAEIVAGEFTSAGLTRAIVDYFQSHPRNTRRQRGLEDS